MKVGIALSGGGAKGPAHLGIIQAFEESGIKIDAYSGSSAGAIVATAKALGYSNQKCIDILGKINDEFLDLDKWSILKGLVLGFDKIEAIMKGKKYRAFLQENFNENIDSVTKPLAIISTDVHTGAQIIFSSEPIQTERSMDDILKVYSPFVNLQLYDMIYASSSIPGIFPPSQFKGHKLIDGSVTNNVPANVLKAIGVDKVVAVDLGSKRSYVEVKGISNIISRSISILIDQNVDLSLFYTNDHLYLDPKVDTIGILDFNESIRAYEVGYAYGKSMAPQVKAFIEGAE